MTPWVIDIADADVGFRSLRARIDFGHFQVEVSRFADEDQWRDEAGNRFTLEGLPLVPAVEVPRLRQAERAEGLCGIVRRYIGGPRKPLPYARRLNALRLKITAGELLGRVWCPAVRVFAGRDAWNLANRQLAREGTEIPLVVLPPGDDPAGYDWAPLGRWRYGRADIRKLKESGHWQPGRFAPRAGAGFWVLIEDRHAPVDEETTDLIAALCLTAGATRVSAVGVHPIDAYAADLRTPVYRSVCTGPSEEPEPGQAVRWVRQDYRAEWVEAARAAVTA